MRTNDLEAQIEFDRNDEVMVKERMLFAALGLGFILAFGVANFMLERTNQKFLELEKKITVTSQNQVHIRGETDLESGSLRNTVRD